jgi:hypothetical protein
MAETVSTSAMAAQVGVSHTALLRHVRRGIVRDDDNDIDNVEARFDVIGNDPERFAAFVQSVSARIC